MSKVIGQTAVSVYPLSNYSFGSKEAKHEKDINMDQRMFRLRQRYFLLALLIACKCVVVLKKDPTAYFIIVFSLAEGCFLPHWHDELLKLMLLLHEIKRIGQLLL
jgi:hypothetical protein